MLKNIKIKQCAGVYSGGSETIAMAQAAFRQKCRSFLDIGAGNGFIAIFLCKNGKKVEALDISPRAIQCARANAKLNKCRLKIFQSNLFEKVKKKYDCITFIPPINSNEKEYQRLGKSLSRSFPFLLDLFRPFLYLITRKNRVKLVNQFIFQARNFLNANGQILISMPINDVDYIEKENINFKIISQPTKLVTICQIKYIT